MHKTSVRTEVHPLRDLYPGLYLIVKNVITTRSPGTWFRHRLPYQQSPRFLLLILPEPDTPKPLTQFVSPDPLDPKIDPNHPLREVTLPLVLRHPSHTCTARVP